MKRKVISNCAVLYVQACSIINRLYCALFLCSRAGHRNLWGLKVLPARVIVASVLLLLGSQAGAQNKSVSLIGVEAIYKSVVTVEQDAGMQFRLTASEAKLKVVIDAIIEKTGTSIHYLVLPDVAISARCQGSLKQLLLCLLGSNVDMVFRDVSAASSNQIPAAQTEVWLLDIPDLNTGNAVSDHFESDTMALNQQNRLEPTDLEIEELTEKLLEMAKDPRQRMDAVAALGTAGHKGDMKIHGVLKKALTDPNPGVRAQAVFALGKREGDDALLDIEAAMQDENADVRRMAVESAGNNLALLQQALKDSDDSIRLYATTKLQIMSNRQNEPR